MKIGKLFTLVIFYLTVWSFPSMADPAQAQQEIWFQKEIQAMLEQDRAALPPQHAIVFTGSSIFRFWVSLEADMRPLPVVNRAFGGARTWEVVHYMDSIILPLKPAIIVYYCGGNDIEYGSGAPAIVQNFTEFCSRAQAALPRTKVFFVSINKAPQKLSKWGLLDEANQLAAAYCAKSGCCEYIDINPPFFTAGEAQRNGMYISDGLHFMPEAYREITKIIKPVLDRTWKVLQEKGARDR